MRSHFLSSVTALAWVVAGSCCVLAAPNAGADEPAKPAAKLPPAVAAQKAADEAKKAHVQNADRIIMSTPPPALRAETKTPTKDAGLVWVPGHWAAVKGEWQWTPGEWRIPATPVSVWIEAKYDAKTKQWSPGYWQPDRPDSYEPPESSAPPSTKYSK